MFHSGLNFFGQPPSNRAAIHEELFNIVYYGEGFTHSEIYHMPLPLRRYYIDLTIKAKKQEQKEMDEIGKNPKFKNPTS